MKRIIIKTDHKREIVDITSEVEKIVEKSSVKTGAVNLFLTHTTAALTTADLDPGGTAQDYLDALNEIVPKLNYRHPHNPKHMPDHILSSLIGTTLTLPIENGSLTLGTWQKIVLIELDGPRERKINLSFLPTQN